jgi:hypothetical protein
MAGLGGGRIAGEEEGKRSSTASLLLKNKVYGYGPFY